jgi:hypothetical protein
MPPLKSFDPVIGSQIVGCSQISSDMQGLLEVVPSVVALCGHACLNHAVGTDPSSSNSEHFQ